MPKFCPYCGNTVKESDKFCIMCGKPLLSSLSTSSPATEPESAPPKNEYVDEDLKKKKREQEMEEIEEDIDEDLELDDTKGKGKEKREPKPLPDDVKEQISLHLELSTLGEKKKMLVDRLDKLQKQLKTGEYETDFEFGENIEIQLKALTTVIAELKQQEDAIKATVQGEFIVEKLKKDIKTKKSQLSNLIREHKLRKIKDKDVVKNLKEKYKAQLTEYQTEYEDLKMGMREWIVQLSEEKVDSETERKTNKARFSAKEITEEQFKSTDGEYDKKISGLQSKIETLKKLAK